MSRGGYARLLAGIGQFDVQLGEIVLQGRKQRDHVPPLLVQIGQLLSDRAQFASHGSQRRL